MEQKPHHKMAEPPKEIPAREDKDILCTSQERHTATHHKFDSLKLRRKNLKYKDSLALG
jgi:hypothetical protein